MRIGNHETHEAADAFPLLEGIGLDGLTDDIKTNGLRDGFEIVLLEGDPEPLILDGRNRYRACLAAKVQPRFRYYEGDKSDEGIVRYIVSVNIARRDLDDGQRALVARRLAKLIRGERKRNLKQVALPGVSDADAGAADALMKAGVPELIAAVDRGDIALSHAAAVAKLEPGLQREAVRRVEKAETQPSSRAKPVDEAVMALAIRLTPVDVVAVRAMLFWCDKSQHGEVRAGADVVRRMVPGMAR